MSGNTFGERFKLTSFGESHGPAIGGVVDGCPAGFELSEQDLQYRLNKRKPGSSKFVSARKESDRVRILSGIYQGKTLGSPIAFIIENENAKTKDYEKIKHVYRPGHGDYVYAEKYGHRDPYGGGRASARETAVRVAAGAIAEKFLTEKIGITIHACLDQLGAQRCTEIDWKFAGSNPLCCPDPSQLEHWEKKIEDCRREGDSIGGVCYLTASNLPVGLGEPVYDKLDARLASAMMGINAVKAVEIGDGFDSVIQNGSEYRDEQIPSGFLSNHCGGVLAGISTGEDLCVRVAFKPTSSVRKPIPALTEDGGETILCVTGRHDPCVAIRGVPVTRAMMALVLMDFYLLNLGRK